MTAKALQNLETITDLLGPGMWLQLDEAQLKRCFGASDPVTAASAFAKESGCVFLRDRKRPAGRFGRAYFKAAASG